MTVARPYGDGCATAHAAELIGERWAPLVIRELLLGPKRFGDLQRGLPKASPNVLSQRLRELESVGVVRRRRLGPPTSTWVYELTDWGQELEPIILSLARWAGRSPFLDRSAALSADSLMLHMRARYDAASAQAPPGRYEIRLAQDHFTVDLRAGALAVHRASAGTPDAVLETDTTTFTALLRGELSLDDATRQGLVSLDGDAAAIAALLQACTFASIPSDHG
jgi:DNA-binding HxlR family transcriptional regulator